MTRYIATTRLAGASIVRGVFLTLEEAINVVREDSCGYVDTDGGARLWPSSDPAPKALVEGEP